jgi:hypothetical protein
MHLASFLVTIAEEINVVMLEMKKQEMSRPATTTF